MAKTRDQLWRKVLESLRAQSEIYEIHTFPRAVDGGVEEFCEKNFDEIFDDFSDFENSLEIGDEIEHAQFGRGKVLQIEGDILTIEFANEVKRIAASIAPLKKV